MNTIETQSTNYLKGFSFSDKIDQKLSFPNIFHSPNKSKISKYNIRVLSLHKDKTKPRPKELSPPITHRYIYRPKYYLNMVSLLTLEDKINDILKSELEIKKQKEKIDKNKMIKLLRLGLYKKKENDEKDNTNNEKNENNDKGVNIILEKEKENEENLEKFENENIEKEKKLEKNYHEKLQNYEQIKKVCHNINKNINRINNKIEDEQFETNVLNKYGEEFDKNFKKKLSHDIDEKNNKDNNNLNSDNDTNRKKDKQFEELNKLIIFRQQREDKKKFLKESIFEKEKMKAELEKDLLTNKEKCVQAKKDLLNIKKKLINNYHLKLYEGLNFHNEGLSSIIKNIWNLGLNVDINFMPTYLDNLSIDFLFQRTRRSIEISNLRKIIKDNENELISYLKEWKLNNNEINNELNKISNIGFYNKNDEHKNTMTLTNEKELFKTNISEISISYLDAYPKTKQFMIDYKKNHPQIFQKDMPEQEIKNIKYKDLGIPVKILEKNKKIEKLKYTLNMKIEQNKQSDKNEVKRLIKEFNKNNYQKKYKVNIEMLFGALFGDKKNEMLIYYSKLEKEIRDHTKTIQFHTKYKFS